MFFSFKNAIFVSNNLELMMEIPTLKRLISVEEYHKMGEYGILPEHGVELINGEIIEMSPIGSLHSSRVNKLNALLAQILGKSVIISIQNSVVLSNFSEPEPDIAILEYRADYYATALPTAEDVKLIIEVAHSSFSYDRKVKLPLYAESGISELWIINLEKEEIEIYWEPAGNNYRFRELLRPGDVLKAKGLNLELDVSEVLLC